MLIQSQLSYPSSPPVSVFPLEPLKLKLDGLPHPTAKIPAPRTHLLQLRRVKNHWRILVSVYIKQWFFLFTRGMSGKNQ